MLTEFEEQQTAAVVASGGGEGMMNISYGANSNFAKDCALTLETCGFIVTESDIEIHRKGMLKRLFNK